MEGRKNGNEMIEKVATSDSVINLVDSDSIKENINKLNNHLFNTIGKIQICDVTTGFSFGSN